MFETRNTRDYKLGPFYSIVGVEEYYYENLGKKIIFGALYDLSDINRGSGTFYNIQKE